MKWSASSFLTNKITELQLTEKVSSGIWLLRNLQHLVNITPSPTSFILNDVSQLQINSTHKCVFFAGLTAAKKMVATRWKPPHTLTYRKWALTFLDIVYLEMSTARLHGAKEENINIWSNIAVKIQNMF